MLLIKLFQLAGPERPSLIAAGLCKVIETACAAVPLGVVYVIGRALLTGEPAPSAWGTALVLAAAFAAQGVFFYLATRLSSSAGFRLTCRLRLRLAEHLRRLPLGEVKRRDSGDLTAVLMQDVTSIEQVPSLIFTRHVAGLTMPVVLLAGCAVVDWRLAALLAVGIPPAVLVHRRAGRRLRRGAAAGVAWRGRMAALILEFLQGMRIVKGFHAERPLARLDEAIVRHRDGCKELTGVAVRAAVGFPALLDAGVLAAGAWAVHGLIAGAVAPADFILVWFVCLRVFTPVHEFIEFSAMLELMDASMVRIAAVLKEEPLPEPADPRRPAAFGVEFERVRFRYGDAEVLHDVSFTVPEGGVTAIVGPSGAGKSTLLRLLMRSWDVSGGAIRIGGVDLRAMDEATRGACVSVVSQDVFLIAGSVRENILVGRPGAGDAEVAAAARAAQCHAFVSALPKGYDTVLGDRGHTLSGGERQRIALARAILKDAPIVLLDEATSALDPQNELLVQQALGTLLRGRTVLVVAHRLRSVVNADRIVVIEDGRIVQQGTHAALAGRDGVYARLWRTYREGEGWIAAPDPRPAPAA